MRLLIVGFALAAMTAAAQAQASSGAQRVGQHAANSLKESDKSAEQKAKINEKAYNSALKNLPDKQYDPWQGVR